MRRLEWATPVEWVARVEADSMALLCDHAHCELKAAVSAQSLIAKNPERGALVTEMASIAMEEMEHFGRVVRLIHGRGGSLAPQDSNPYAEALLSRSGPTRRYLLLDRLLVAQLIEARSFERFQLLAEHLDDAELRALYRGLMVSEASHRALFARFAREYYDEGVVSEREAELFALEGDVVASLPFEYRVHSGVL